MAELVKSDDQSRVIAEALSIPHSKVDLILKSYRKYVKYMVNQGVDTALLGSIMVYHTGNKTQLSERDTFAYQITVVANELGESRTLVEAVLEYLKYIMIKSVRDLGFSYSIFSLVRLDNVGGKLKLRGSATLPTGYRVKALARFREVINEGK